MIKIKETEVNGFKAAIRGMRNPMNSWDKSDSRYSCLCMDDKRDCPAEPYIVGPNDLALMKKLSKAGTDHSKFLRFITATISGFIGICMLFILGYQDPLRYTIEQQLFRYQIAFWGLVIVDVFGLITYCLGKIKNN